MKRITFLVFLALPLWAGAQAAQRGSALLPAGAGKPIVERACAACHSLDVVTAERGTAAHWNQVVNQMVGRGADLSDPEVDTVVKYLSSHFGPATASEAPAPASGANIPATSAAPAGPVNVNTASAQDLQSLGLNQKQAEAIVQYREKNGKFKTWQDIAAIPEETPNQIEAMQDRLTY